MANHKVWLASQAGRLDELAHLPPELFDRVTLERALYVAVVNDHAGIVRFMLRAGKNTHQDTHLPWNTFRNTPLNTAARHSSAGAMRALVEAKADVNCDTSTRPALVIAVVNGATTCVRVLVLAKADLEATSCNGFTPVCAAAKNGDIGVLRLLLQHKASADRLEPVTWAARHGHVGVVHLLLLAKAGMESARCHGCTPLIAASNHGHVAVMLLLLRAKADAMHCMHISGWSALSAAAVAGQTTAVRCLLQHAPALATMVTRALNPHPDGDIPAGSTPLDLARRFEHADVVALLVAATYGQ